MTQPPHTGPPLPPDAGRSGTDEIHDGLPPAPPEPSGARRGRRGLVLAGAATGALVLGGSGYAVASYLSGGGAQPEEVLPADTLAFAKLDLDPAANQKAAVFSLLQQFPDLGAGGDGDGDGGDLTGTVVTPLLEDGPWGLSYDSDVEPWLGDRMAVAAVPEPASEAGLAPVVVLAVTDREAMTDRLGAVQDAEFAFAVRDDYVLIGETQATVDRLAASGATLAEDEEYAGDLAALDGDQVAVAWADLAGLADVLGETMATMGAGLGGQPVTGRTVLGVHAESDALVVEGLTRGVTAPAGAAAATEPTRLVLDLPEDTLAALSVSGLGDAAAEAWTAAGTGVPLEVREQVTAWGLDLPDDLRTILGSDSAVAVLGDVTAPQFGVRAVTEDPQRAVQVLGQVLGGPEAGLPVTAVPLEDGYVLSTDPALADVLAGDGGLGDTEAFRAAVADPDTAGAIGFVDLGALVDQAAAQGGDSAVRAEELAALGALGFSASTTDDGSRFVLRITTR